MLMNLHPLPPPPPPQKKGGRKPPTILLRSVSLNFIESRQKKTFREFELNIVINQIYAINLV